MTEPCSHIHRPSHMRGWEAFGVTDGLEPTVRRLGLVVGRNADQVRPGTEPFGPGETRNGVWSIEVHTFADNPGEAYVYVVGTTEKGVGRAWRKTRNAWRDMSKSIW